MASDRAGAGATSDPALLPAHEQRRRILAGELTAVGLLEACEARVRRHNEALNAVVTFNPAAHDEAAAVDARLAAGDEAGLLAGLVVGIKDVTETAGLRTTYGSPLYADHVPEEDALVVRRLREAGAVILGKTNTPEFAAGGNTWNDVFGVTRNPWDPSRSAGGSTGGGAVAVATGMISLAQGTDLGGSLRIPASFCGVAGLRPTVGLVPTYPSAYLWDDLQVTGFLARTAADIALAIDAVSGASPETPVVAPARRLAEEMRAAEAARRGGPERATADPLRVAYCPDLSGIGIDAAVGAACRAAVDAIEGRGFAVEEIALDLAWARDAYLALRGHWFVSHFHDHLDRIDAFGPNVAANLRSGLEVTMRELGAGENARRRVRERFLELFERFAAVLTPCMAVPPFPAEDNYPTEIGGRPMATYMDWLAPTFLLSLPGLPVACAPAGLDPTGFPVGLQVVVPPYEDARALSIASEIEAAAWQGRPVPRGIAIDLDEDPVERRDAGGRDG